MGLDDGRAHRQADAHAVLAAVRRGVGICTAGTGKQRPQALFRDATAIVLHLEHRPAAQGEHPQGQGRHALGVEHCIFQQVHQHLPDQHGIHGDHDEVIRQVQLHRNIRIALLELDQHRVHQFFQYGGRFFHGHLFAVNAGHRQQIFHHTVQPLGILTGLAQQFEGLFLAQLAVVLHHGRASPINGGERGAQVMGHRPQQVGPHLFLFALHAQLLLLFDAGGQGAGHARHHQHYQTGEQVLRQGEVECKIRGKKRKVDGQHADERRQHAPYIAFGIHGDHEHRQHEQQHGHAIDAAHDLLEQHHRRAGRAERDHHDRQILGPIGLFHSSSLPESYSYPD